MSLKAKSNEFCSFYIIWCEILFKRSVIKLCLKTVMIYVCIIKNSTTGYTIEQMEAASNFQWFLVTLNLLHEFVSLLSKIDLEFL